MSDIQEFSNDSEDERAAGEEEGKTLAASDSWIGLANSTPHRLKVKTYSEYVRELETKGLDCQVTGTTDFTISLPQFVAPFSTSKSSREIRENCPCCWLNTCYLGS